jgi:hypothetical protein
VERVEAELMLGFFFPGAEVDTSKLPGPPIGVEPPDATGDPSSSATPAAPG